MTIYDLKPRFQALLRPVCRQLARWGITANQVTLAALGLSIATGTSVLFLPETAFLLALPVVLLVRMALNALDGMLAREHDQKTPLGAVLNEMGDVLSDVGLTLPLAALPQFSAPLIYGVVLLTVLTETAGLVPLQIGGSRRYDGPMGKSDRAFVFGLIALALAVGIPAGPWLSWGLGLIMVLLVLTVINRLARALKETSACVQSL